MGAPMGWRYPVAAIALSCALAGCGRQPVPPGAADYASLGFARQCLPGTKSGGAGIVDDVVGARGARFNVRTPSNYDPGLAHPLLVVYAPAGRQRFASEAFAGLTAEATARGFIVAYPDHRPLALSSIEVLGEVPGAVAARWCIDAARVYAVGHSDGGTVAEAIVFLGKSGLPLAGLVASGAGIRGEDLASHACPAPRPAMIIHSRDDRLFPLPAHGRQAADWWASCNRCAASPPVPRSDGCLAYRDCAMGATTRYCEIAGPHTRWPGMNATLLDFLARAPSAGPRRERDGN
jgi:polyhydroxybutyrate depolymerase